MLADIAAVDVGDSSEKSSVLEDDVDDDEESPFSDITVVEFDSVVSSSLVFEVVIVAYVPLGRRRLRRDVAPALLFFLWLRESDMSVLESSSFVLPSRNHRVIVLHLGSR